MLTFRQLEMVAHVANGLTTVQIAERMHLSRSSVQATLNTARKRANARTLPHLVSIVIASGVLEWNEDKSTRGMAEVNGIDN